MLRSLPTRIIYVVGASTLQYIPRTRPHHGHCGLSVSSNPSSIWNLHCPSIRDLESSFTKETAPPGTSTLQHLWYVERLLFHGQKYLAFAGKIFRLRVLNDNFIILNDPKVAEDILGKRSVNYASRKFLPYASFYRSGNKRMILMPYGEEFKKQRAAIAMLFRPDGIKSNRDRQECQAKKFLYDITTTPQDYAIHLKQYSAGIALGVGFGMSIEQAHIEAPNLIANTAAVGADKLQLFPGLWLVE
ncbi:hypothetical protein C0995_016200 [Termitomyces sp. Mi166|nr:hypothetical protein C0995_016200 [Termitomyces sp. Mi166\